MKLSMILSLIVALPLVSHAASSPICFVGTDSERIEKAVAEACRTGGRSVCIEGKPDGTPWLIERAILLPSDFILEIDDCLVQLKPGTQDNLIRNAGAVGQSEVAPNRNITIRGKGRAVLCGGTENHYAPNRSGDVNGWRTIGILFCAVDGFTIEGVTLRETQAWGISVENGCANGFIRGIRFEDTNKMLNQDGVDVRKGCHDIVIENITGVCGDDVVALTALRSRKPTVSSKPCMQVGGNVPTDSDDVYNVTIRNIRARCAGGHGVVRLLCQDGIKMHHITVSNIVDTTEVEKGDKPAQAVIRIGDVNYWSICPAAKGDMHHIHVDGVQAKGHLGVWIKGVLSDSELRNIFVPSGARVYDIEAPIIRVTAE